MEFHEFTSLAFLLCNSVRVVAYLPQICSAASDTSGCKGISCATWSMFLLSNLTVAMYAAVNLADARMALVFVSNAVCCIVILAIVLYRRHVAACRQPTAPPTTHALLT